MADQPFDTRLRLLSLVSGGGATRWYPAASGGGKLMAHVPHRAHGQPAALQSWPRRRIRRWARTSDMATMFAAIPSLPRHELSRLTAAMIDRMDDLDADPDVEPNGDELDGHPGEDEFLDHAANLLGYPGCLIADPGEDGNDREREEAHE